MTGNGSGGGILKMLVLNDPMELVAGDTIVFQQDLTTFLDNVPKDIGKRTVTAEVLHDSIDAGSHTKTVTIEVKKCEGDWPLPEGFVTTLEVGHVFKHTVSRFYWENELARSAIEAYKAKYGGSIASLMAATRMKQENKIII